MHATRAPGRSAVSWTRGPEEAYGIFYIFCEFSKNKINGRTVDE
jgi:hypothetical protein